MPVYMVEVIQTVIKYHSSARKSNCPLIDRIKTEIHHHHDEGPLLRLLVLPISWHITHEIGTYVQILQNLFIFRRQNVKKNDNKLPALPILLHREHHLPSDTILEQSLMERRHPMDCLWDL